MGYNNRELEIKLQIEGALSLASIEGIFDGLLGEISTHKVTGKSKDVYWKAPKKAEADFVRVRYFPENSGELTLKYTDKNIRDRVEIDVKVEDPDQAVAFQKQLLGEPTGELTKKYVVYFLSKGSTISLYKVQNDPRVFVEVEARTKDKMDEMYELIKEKFPLKFTVVDKSIFELFIKD